MTAPAHSHLHPTAHASSEFASPDWPENPIVARAWRGRHLESVHRGAWVLADVTGAVVDGAGDWNHAVFARSSVKSLQALPLLETGAAQRFEFRDDELALTLASHHAEDIHVRRVRELLARLGLGPEHLQCGAQLPTDSAARRALTLAGEQGTRVHNNCSGKHTGFLALALHMGVDPKRYLEHDNAAQSLVRRTVEELSGVRPGELDVAIDGCSAPTFHLPLVRLATALARIANPHALAEPRRRACERLVRVAAEHPELIGGTRHSMCTDLLRASGGMLFPKLGAEAVYVLGVRERGLGLAVKIDDGNYRAMHPLVIELCERFGLLSRDSARALPEWRQGVLRNWAGLEVGRMEVVA
ncbi:MAG: asparaginase [Planctomycetes bacterium]|nr:asparaginase [Planctomycetota bacterium]